MGGGGGGGARVPKCQAVDITNGDWRGEKSDAIKLKNINEKVKQTLFSR